MPLPAPSPEPTCLRWLPLAFLLAWYACMGLTGPLVDCASGDYPPLLLGGHDMTNCCACLILMLLVCLS